MENKGIIFPELFFTDKNLVGRGVCKVSRKIADLKGIFADVEAFEKMPRNQLAYEVSSFLPEKEGTPGGLYFGITYLYPGKVGNEYMMTKGHYHANIDRAEYYWGLEGEGMLILMDEQNGYFPVACTIFRAEWHIEWRMWEARCFHLQHAGLRMQVIIMVRLQKKVSLPD